MMDRKLLEKAIREMIIAIGEDPDREGLKNTPVRISKLYEDIFSGVGKDARKNINVYKAKNEDEMVILSDIPFYSMCEHHFLPFFGNVHIAYIPKDNQITGFSNLIDVVDTVSKRPQIQERMTTEIADTINDMVNPLGVLVVVEARQFCVEFQGRNRKNIKTVTSAIRGAFRKNATRQEALQLLRKVSRNEN
ncbi:GTP cyclohydrolase I FolE [candidate division WOR-3 bacterium]|uniref:GTP cyclohydrolase 1 n=1 Tax=candidate division TA06 bacterium TaxID=2250710 RepID=A0A660S5N2_UNCT6|nr:GTP cyclohydrolase I FolE [candidate division WOR-3 bacterium]RKX65039.1 MAG: GTP cyclohydrolase I FolE [candidate division TA06 bacterium]HHD82733.1 GTP cyclohydrolase I FolE [Bacteroidota bacterium]